MAGFNIHLAVAKRYVEIHDIEDAESFYLGSVSPDFTDDKNATHYSNVDKRDSNDLVKYLFNKVNLEKYLEENAVESDYEKGVFLHLVTDFLFFNTLLDKEYLTKTSYDEFRKDLYYSYDITNEHIYDVYGIDYDDYSFGEKLKKNVAQSKSNVKTCDGKRTNILPNEEIENFVERVSKTRIDEYLEKIRTKGAISLLKNV